MSRKAMIWLAVGLIAAVVTGVLIWLFKKPKEGANVNTVSPEVTRVDGVKLNLNLADKFKNSTHLAKEGLAQPTAEAPTVTTRQGE